MLFLDILAEFLAEDLLYNKVKDYLAIRKGELKDSAFEKFYKTLVVDFINWQPGLDKEQAEKFFADSVTIDGVLAFLYNFADPNPAIRDKTKAALCEWANRMRLSGSLGSANAPLMERFLTRLEEELRHDANKSLLPYFADIRGDIANAKAELQEEVGKAKEEIIEKLEGLGEQWEKYAAEQKARAERATQIDPSGEQMLVDGKPVYNSTQKVEPRLSGALPIIRCDLEAIDEENHKYRAVITNESGKELHKHNFTLKPDDAFLLEANHFLEHDGLRDYRTHLALESDRTFTKRLGNHFYSLIMGANGALRDKVEDGALETGFQFVLTLDTEAELLWQVPWEYLHDSEEFLGLSGNAHVVRTPKGAGSLRVSAIPQPLKILVVVSNPSGEGEFDSERALAAIQEALDYSRRMGWVELDYLEEATFAHFQSRLAAFQPHVVHYIGHGGKNPHDAAAIQPPYSGKPGETYLAFANDDGEVAPLYGKALKRLLADTPSVQLLVLSGCMTGQTAFSDALAGAGTALLREKLPALVVMQYSILVDTAIQFAKVFYEAIGRGESLSRGLTHVRQVLAQSRGEHRADWGIPALYLRSPELQLVDPRAAAPSPEQRRRGRSEHRRLADGGRICRPHG